jgi:hypothetical protein
MKKTEYFCMVISNENSHKDPNWEENWVEIYSDDDELEALAIMISDYAVTPDNHEQYSSNWPGYEDTYNLYVLNEETYDKTDLLRWADQYKADIQTPYN